MDYYFINCHGNLEINKPKFIIPKGITFILLTEPGETLKMNVGFNLFYKESILSDI